MAQEAERLLFRVTNHRPVQGLTAVSRGAPKVGERSPHLIDMVGGRGRVETSWCVGADLSSTRTFKVPDYSVLRNSVLCQIIAYYGVIR